MHKKDRSRIIYLTLLCVIFAFLMFASLGMASEEVEVSYVKGPMCKGFVWDAEVPKDCPFEQSSLFNRIYFTGLHSDYRCGDTWYPSWASNGNLYSPWTDGVTTGIRSWSSGFSNNGNINDQGNPIRKATTSQAMLIGEDPMKLQIKVVGGVVPGDPYPYGGRYPCGSLVYNDIWYYGTYCLSPYGITRYGNRSYNWPWLGPLVGFRYSTDYGKTWTETHHTPAKPLFDETGLAGYPVKMGSPHFVDFGRNMEHSPDGKAYLVGHGAEVNDPKPRFANLSWICGDQVYMTRVTPSIENINDKSKYEYFGGNDQDGDPIWTSEFAQIKPLIDWNNNCGCVTITYNAPLKKYLMCITDGWPTAAKMSSYILESDTVTGPWQIITYMKDFGEQAYFLNFPSKFISEDGKYMWLCYSANFSPGWDGVKLKFNPPGGRYGLCLHEMRFLSKDEKYPSADKDPDILSGNIAPQAQVTVSSTYAGYSSKGLVDGEINGYPGNISTEWASNEEKAGAWVRLEWTKKRRIDRILLFDRPVDCDQVVGGTLLFSDGSSVLVNKELPNSAYEGIQVKFKSREVKWFKFVVDKTSDSTLNIGLSEIAVFGAGQRFDN